MRSTSLLLLYFLAVVFSQDAKSQEADPEELPRPQLFSPEEAMDTFQLRPGIALDQVAHEPLVEDPVSIAFDEDGRLFAVEMRGYSERRDDNRGQIRLLFDDDDDGFFDRSTVFAKDLKWPTGLVCSRGGVFVIATPDLIWLKDTDGDGVADERKVVFTGFASAAKKLNVQGLANSLKWGPDNRIWGSAGTLGGNVRKPDQPEKEAMNLGGSDFSFDPVALDLRAENGRAQYGLSFDSHGRRYVSSNSVHLIAVMWERGWEKANPWFSLPKPLESIATDGGAAPVYRISPDEPWRIVRTRWRVAGVVGGPVEGGGRVSGYFTGASGVTIYTGDVLGPDYSNNAFIGDVGSNLVHRKVISNHEGKVSLRGDRAADEAAIEFIASRDNWFRPTTYANAPDGCLYISDMYREIIEHPWSLPEGIKKHLDLNSGNDRGRVYRARPTDYTRRKTPKLSTASNDELVDLLQHPNGWHRVTAQRLLWERRDQQKRYGSGWRDFAPADPSLVKLKKALILDDADTIAGNLLSFPDDKWLAAASLHSVNTPEIAGRVFALLSKQGISETGPFLSLVEIIGRMNEPDMTAEVFAAVGRESGSAAVSGVLGALGNGLAKAGSSLRKADEQNQLAALFAAARQTLGDSATSIERRKSAIQLLAFSSGNETEVALVSALEDVGNKALFVECFDSLSRVGSDSLVSLVSKYWAELDSDQQEQVIGISLRNVKDTQALLVAIKESQLPKSVLSLSRVQLLRETKSDAIRQQMAALYPQPKVRLRSEVVAEFQPALTLAGDPKNGKVIYQTACASCHRYGEQGHAVGPDLATFQSAGPDSIIANIFDPNQEVAPQYQAFLFSLKNGEQSLGVIDQETVTEISLKMPSGLQKSFLRSDVESMKSLGRSLMPEGLENALTPQTVADLLAFIKDPAAAK